MMEQDRTSPEGWPTTRFGDVVHNVRTAESDPLSAGLERYVGLEHLDPESLHIKRWGLVEDGTSFTQKFIQGQVLFGKRRAYQRKAAVAEFDGICSGDLLVFESKDDRLLPELLPFIIQSEGFFAHALTTSAGSLSPRTRWKDLAAYEFPLPPLDEQRRIAEILWATEDLVTKIETALGKIEESAWLTFETAVTSNSWQRTQLEELLVDVQYGTSKRSGAQTPNSVPVLRIPNVIAGKIDLSDLSWVELIPEEQERYSVKAGDILLVRTNGNPSYVARCVAVEAFPEDAVFASYLIRLRVNEDRIRPAYLSALINSKYQRKTLTHEIRSSAGNYNINTQGIKRQRIPLPPLDEQDQILKTMCQFNVARESLKGHMGTSHALKRRLLSRLLEPGSSS